MWFSLFLLSDTIVLNCHYLQETRQAAFVGIGIAAQSDAFDFSVSGGGDDSLSCGPRRRSFGGGLGLDAVDAFSCLQTNTNTHSSHPNSNFNIAESLRFLDRCRCRGGSLSTARGHESQLRRRANSSLW